MMNGSKPYMPASIRRRFRWAHALGAQAERRFPNRLWARGSFGGHLATQGQVKPAWKPALRRGLRAVPLRPKIPDEIQIDATRRPYKHSASRTGSWNSFRSQAR